MSGYKFIEYQHPVFVGTKIDKYMPVQAVECGVPGLLIVPKIHWNLTVMEIKKVPMVVHVATGRVFSGPHKSIGAAIKNAKAAGELFDFTRFKTVRGWWQIMKQERAVCKKLKGLAGRKP